MTCSAIVVKDTRRDMHDETLILKVSVLDEAIGLENVNTVDGHGHGNVSIFHLDRVVCNLLRGQDELRSRKMKLPVWCFS